MDTLQTQATDDSASTALVTDGTVVDSTAGASAGADIDANGDATAIAELGDADLTTLLDAIPADDTDIAAQVNAPMYKDVVAQRTQLRTLASTVRELQPLTIYRDLGEPDYVRGRLEALDAMFSPVLDRTTNQPLRDPKTGTTYYTTRPFFEAQEKESDGFCMQAFADLGTMEFPNGTGVMESLYKQYLRYLNLDPARILDYQNIDKLLAETNAAVSLDELVNIPTDYHEAYRLIPASVRATWATIKEGDRALLLQEYKSKIDEKATKAVEAKERANRDAYELAQYHGRVAEARVKFFDTVRRERFTAISESLSKQVKFSDDPVRNAVLHGATIAVLANVLDPELRFVSENTTLKALNIKLPQDFLNQIKIFNAAANEYVALDMADEKGRAVGELEKANKAANRIMAKLAVIQLDVAKAMGGTVLEGVNKQNAATSTAAQGRESVTANAVTATTEGGGILPPGMRPDSPEAAKFFAENYRERMRNVAAV